MKVKQKTLAQQFDELWARVQIWGEQYGFIVGARIMREQREEARRQEADEKQSVETLRKERRKRKQSIAQQITDY